MNISFILFDLLFIYQINSFSSVQALLFLQSKLQWPPLVFNGNPETFRWKQICICMTTKKMFVSDRCQSGHISKMSDMVNNFFSSIGV